MDKLGKGMEEVKAADIQVVPEDFLEKAKDGGTDVVELIKSLNLASWGGDVSCPSLCLLALCVYVRVFVCVCVCVCVCV